MLLCVAPAEIGIASGRAGHGESGDHSTDRGDRDTGHPASRSLVASPVVHLDTPFKRSLAAVNFLALASLIRVVSSVATSSRLGPLANDGSTLISTYKPAQSSCSIVGM